MDLFGRKKIFTANEDINKDNVVNEVTLALELHFFNLMQEDYLYWYRRGVQPILERTKEIRPEINNKVVVNHAAQVVVFKNGYFLTAPTSYKSRRDDETITEKVRQLNEFIYTSGKHIVDNHCVDWFHTVGLGVEYVEPNDSDISPIKVHALDPRSAFVVYSLRPGNEPVMGVNIVIDKNIAYYDVITKNFVFKLKGSSIGREVTDKPLFSTPINLIDTKPNVIGEIPIIEYQYDSNRMSAFEVAIPLMDEYNNIESNRADGVELQIQQLCVAYNCNFDEGTTANDIRQAGMLVLRSLGDNKADFKILESKLSQTETQTSLDALYTQILDKCGLPNIARSEAGSSDNGSAVYLKSGYALADTNRRDTEDLWRMSDRRFLKVALAILKKRLNFELEIEDFDLNIEAPQMSNLLVKTQAAMNMRELGLAPEIWLERSGLSNDPLTDIEVSPHIMDFYSKSEKEEMKSTEEVLDEERTEGETLYDEAQIEEVPALQID